MPHDSVATAGGSVKQRGERARLEIMTSFDKLAMQGSFFSKHSLYGLRGGK